LRHQRLSGRINTLAKIGDGEKCSSLQMNASAGRDFLTNPLEARCGDLEAAVLEGRLKKPILCGHQPGFRAL
jgi:hypothetical protein